jgi:hypothetical protein
MATYLDLLICDLPTLDFFSKLLLDDNGVLFTEQDANYLPAEVVPSERLLVELEIVEDEVSNIVFA